MDYYRSVPLCLSYAVLLSSSSQGGLTGCVSRSNKFTKCRKEQAAFEEAFPIDMGTQV